ncbi:MAG: alkaline phosphatase family protein [Polyangiales bacterium]
MALARVTALALLLAACAPAPRPRPPPPPPPPPAPVVAAPDPGPPRRSPWPAGARPYAQVVIVSFDGLRHDASMIPEATTLARVRAEGAEANRAETVRPSLTLPSHASMLSGAEVSEHGLDFDEYIRSRGLIRVPTAFSYAREAGLTTAMFVSKRKLRHLLLPGTVDVWSLPGRHCERVADRAARHLRDAPAGMTFIHFSEPDLAGHRAGWMSRRYLRAVRRADRCLATVMEGVESRPDRVLVIVTADHGGHGRRHGAGEPVDTRIPWLAWGPGVRRGSFDAPVRTLDTAATALAALGVEIPERVRGEVVRAAFEVDAAR